MPHAPTDSPPRLRRRLGAAAALVTALLVGLVAVAPSALAYHPEPTASVACVEDAVVLDWTTTSWGGPELWGPDFYNEDVRVYVQYGDADGPLGGLTDIEIGSGAFTSESLSFSGTTTITPPEGATQVRVHSEALATWGSGQASIADPMQTTDWLALPGECGDVPPPPPVCEWDPQLPADDPECTPPPPPPMEIDVAASITYACDAPRQATVDVTSTGGASTFVVLVDGTVVETLADVEGAARASVAVPTDVASQVTVLVDGTEVAVQAVDPAECVEVGGVVTQPVPPTTAPPAPAAAPVLPRTGVSSGMLAVVAIALAGLGAVFLTTGRRAALVESEDRRRR
ncbi:hypothetical protein [Actinomarinicola tropica]|uniref:LPXTG cell wall anchor domain-containing protein n=1 Tax=Actinomarinicola tropica TaxID=2789776 RepID=A0A5Q2RIT1_9ACTN|nr:hypothetical protein [Actinomarinicola tropica]QGG96768.1 hypothetical protein GH723_17625 [Actinomarinicola tropica]